MQKALWATLFVFTHIFTYAQLEKTYPNSETHVATGGCVLCNVVDSEKSIGSNENDYATLRIPIGINARIIQTFNFQNLVPGFRKLTIGIETPNVSIKEQAKRDIYIETFNGNTTNNDYKKIDLNMLKPGPDPNKGTIEFTTTKPFTKIELSIHSGLVGLGEDLRIYYVHHLPSRFTTCGNPPLDPAYYFPFDGNSKIDIIRGTSLTPPYVNNLLFSNGVCGKALGDTNTPLYAGDIPLNPYATISFWAKATTNNSEILFLTNLFGERHFKIQNEPEFRHYTIKINPESASLYRDGKFVPGKGIIINGNQLAIILSMINASIDELIIYHRELSDTEILALAQSYNTSLNKSIDTNTLQTETINEIFTISPNPTTGQIAIESNFPMEGSEIFISNTSGKEVYRSKFTSKTFDLPTTLPGGVYMLTLQTRDKKVYTRKVILTR